MTTVVIEPTEIIGSDGRVTFEGIFACEESGVYYAAVHCISDADMYGLMIYKLNVEVGPALTAPAAPELTVTAGAEGAMKADIAITVPTLTVGGNMLASNLTKVELYRDGDIIKEFENVTPGTSLSFTDTDIDESGTVTYQAVPYNESGIGAKSTKVKVFVGEDVPEHVANIKVTDQMSSVLLTWDAVSAVGENGGYVNPATVTYKVIACEPGSTFILDSEPVATVTGQTSVEVNYNTNEGEQGYQAWIVVPANDAGEPYIYEAQLATLTVGKPYDLPVVESFADGMLHYYYDWVGTPLISTNASDDDGIALALTSGTDNSLVAFTTGKLNIKDAENPKLVMDVAAFGADNFTVMASKNGDVDNAQNVATFENLTEEYQTVTVDLSSLKDADYVLLGFMAHINTGTVFDWSGAVEEEGDAIQIDNIRILDQRAVNLGVEVVTVDELQQGYMANVVAVVMNWGEQPASGYTVVISAGDEELLRQTVSEELEPYKSATFVAELAASLFGEAGSLPITATVEYQGDEIASDNTAETSVTITEPIVPSPDDVYASGFGSVVKLSWSAPTATVDYTETFELGVGGWSSYDIDGDSYAWNYNENLGGGIEMYTTSGFCSVYSESYSNQVGPLSPDNWLVSPQVVLDGTFSFFAAGQDPSWCEEHFAVYVTTGDPNDMISYEQVSEELIATDAMTEYTVDLSSYGGEKGYVAIRHYNVSDMFALVIDDISYQVGSTPEAYNIYIDGELVATVPGSQTTFNAGGLHLAQGEHTLAVTAVYSNEQESKPVTVSYSVTTGVDAVSSDNEPVDVYTLDGRRVRTQTTSTDGLKGAYIVRSAQGRLQGKKVILK